MISTLKALFQGRRELFRGLKIEKTDWDWVKEIYPVLHLDMSVVTSKDAAPVDFARKFKVQTLDSPEAFSAPAAALLYQGGYQTINRRIDSETVVLKFRTKRCGTPSIAVVFRRFLEPIPSWTTFR